MGFAVFGFGITVRVGGSDCYRWFLSSCSGWHFWFLVKKGSVSYPRAIPPPPILALIFSCKVHGGPKTHRRLFKKASGSVCLGRHPIASATAWRNLRAVQADPTDGIKMPGAVRLTFLLCSWAIVTNNFHSDCNVPLLQYVSPQEMHAQEMHTGLRSSF